MTYWVKSHLLCWYCKGGVESHWPPWQCRPHIWFSWRDGISYVRLLVSLLVIGWLMLTNMLRCHCTLKAEEWINRMLLRLWAFYVHWKISIRWWPLRGLALFPFPLTVMLRRFFFQLVTDFAINKTDSRYGRHSNIYNVHLNSTM
jgi:hypothetical protein